MTCKKIVDINHAFYSHINRAWTLPIYKHVIISRRYTAIKTCPYIIGILIRHLIPSTLIKVKTKK